MKKNKRPLSAEEVVGGCFLSFLFLVGVISLFFLTLVLF